MDISRERKTFWENKDGLRLVLGDQWDLVRWWDITGNTMRLSAQEIQTCFNTMMWDMYEEMSPETQKACRELLKNFEDTNDSATWLLEGISLLNIEKYIIEWNQSLDITAFDSGYDCMSSREGVDFIVYEDLFHQVNFYRTNWKLQPPELYTIWNIEWVRLKWRDAVRELLELTND